MRKFLLSILFIGLAVYANAQRNNRINLSIDFGLGVASSEIEDDRQGRVLADLGFGAEYARIFDSGFLAGGGIQAGSRSLGWIKTIGSTNYTYITEGGYFALYPLIGYAYGNNQNTQVLVQPLKIDSTSVTKIEVQNDGSTVMTDTKTRNFIMYKTGVYYSKQWGKNLLRNGFIFGGDIVWTSSGDFKKSSGLELLIGYKLSFGF